MRDYGSRVSEGAHERPWALILGASSGFGAAVAEALAADAFNVCGVHLDRRSTVEQAAETKRRIEQAGARALFVNANAADEATRARVLDALAEVCPPGGLRVLFHSLAFGSLVALVGEEPSRSVRPQQLAMTLEVMATSLVWWTQEVVWRGLMAEGGRILAMTSSGSTRALPAYGPVSAAKAALEALVRQLALELGGRGITANAIRAGVTDTAALRKIPGWESLRDRAEALNPSGRLTDPTDVANVVRLLVRDEARWINGVVLPVDGGEEIAG